MQGTLSRVAVVLVGFFALALGNEPANAQIFEGPALEGIGAPEFIPGEILVKFADDAPVGFADTVHASFGSHVIYESPWVHFQRVAIAASRTELDMVQAYSQLPYVEYAELNTICHAHATPNDTYYSLQWHFPQINMPQAWDTSTGSGVVVAILDSGVAYEDFPVPSYEATTVATGVTTYLRAPDHAGTNFVAGYDYIHNDTHPNDNNSHGTHVSGTVAQTTNNALGVAGVAYNASIMPVKVLDYTGSGSAQSLADGLYFAANNGAQVVNMSLGWSPGYNPGSTVSNAITYAYNAGVTLVSSAGNSGTGTVSYPAAYPECIAVGATRFDNTRSYYSQWGSALDIMAPGGDVNVNQNGDAYVDGILQQTFVGYAGPGSKANPTSFGYYFFQGTSMASPHIAGVVALMIANGITGVENIRTTIQSTATDLGTAGWDSGFGWGLVNAQAAVEAGGGGDTTPPNPNPMTWASPPASSGTTSITMTATTASDPSGVQYFFEALTAGAHSSSWQSSPTYQDTGLTPNTTYTYRVKARDQSSNLNETGYSSNASATTDAGGGWTVLAFDDFEASFGNYTDGGADCSRYTGGTHAYQGLAAIDIQDNSGTPSAFSYTGNLDLATPGYTQLEIEFAFKAVSMETGEDFWVQYYNGTTWVTIGDFNAGTQFLNNTFYIGTVTISETSYTFPSNAKIRFRCDASDNNDDVYIDTVTIRAQ